MKWVTEEQHQAILDRLVAVEKQIAKKHDVDFLDNQQFIQVMNISKRLAQRWRDAGLIAHSMVGNKIYYQIKDIKIMLSANHRKAKNY